MIDYLFRQTPLFYFIQPFWRDEAFSYLLAKKNLWQIIFLTAKDFNPPLYYLFLHFWIKIFGQSEIALRSLSLIFFWATLIVVFLFLTNIFRFSLKKSFFYLVFFLVNPLLNYYALEARMYSMFAFFSTLSFYAFWQKNTKVYFWATLFGLFTNYFMIFVILGQLVFYFFSKEKKYFLRLKEIIHPVLFFLPWLFFVWIRKKLLLSSFWILPLTFKDLFLIPAIIYTGYEFSFNLLKKPVIFFYWFFIFFIFFIFVFFILNKEKRIKKIIIFLTVWSLFFPFLIGLISFYKPIFLPRYLIFANIGLILLLIFLLEQLPFFIRLIIILLLLNQTLNYNQIQIKERKKADIRKTIKEIKLLAKKDDVLYVTDVLNYHPAAYYFDENRVFLYQKNYEEIPDYVGKVLIPKEKIIYTLPIFPKKAFILTDNIHYQIQSSL